MPEENITTENYAKVEIEKLALNQNFGELKFISANKHLSKMQEWFKEVDGLDYQSKLPNNAVKKINQYRSQFIDQLNWLRQFTLTGTANPVEEHKNFENKVVELHNNIYEELVARHLPYLRQEVQLTNKDEKQLQDQLQAVDQARIKSEDALKILEQKIEEINKEKQSVDTKQSQLGVKRLAKHFEEEISFNDKQANKWLEIRNKFYWAIGMFILVAVIYSIVRGWDNISIPEGVTKAVILSVIWYGLSFATRNHNIYAQLSASNRHRAAVARTLEDFLDIDPERQADMLRNATEAMCKNLPIGFVSKTEKESSGPIGEIINNFLPPKNS